MICIWLQNELNNSICYQTEHKQTKDSSPVSTVLFRLYCLEIEAPSVLELKDGAASGQYPLLDSITEIGNMKHIHARALYSSLKTHMFFLLKRERPLCYYLNKVNL